MAAKTWLVSVACLLTLAGCGTGSVNGGAAQPAVTASPAPKLVTECQIVSYPQPNLTALDNAEADNFNGPGQSAYMEPDNPPVYQVTLNDTGTAPVMVNDTDTVLFDGTSELISDAEDIGQLISPGASLTFTFAMPTSLVTSQTDDWGNPVDYNTDANSCLVERWS